jgi:hypothetical protein
MTKYADLKVSPQLRDVLEDAAQLQYDQSHGSISRVGHEAGIAWLVLRCDDDITQHVLQQHGYDDIHAVIQALRDKRQDGRFSGDDDFDPLAAVRTPPNMGDTT